MLTARTTADFALNYGALTWDQMVANRRAGEIKSGPNPLPTILPVPEKAPVTISCRRCRNKVAQMIGAELHLAGVVFRRPITYQCSDCGKKNHWQPPLEAGSPKRTERAPHVIVASGVASCRRCDAVIGTELSEALEVGGARFMRTVTFGCGSCGFEQVWAAGGSEGETRLGTPLDGLIPTFPIEA